MTKPSQRRPIRHDQAGCMWGLISILDFRHGTRSTRKLLAARRRGSRQTLGVGDLNSKRKSSTDVEEDLPGNLVDEEIFKMTAAGAPANRPSVKTLIEEEMVDEQHIRIKTSDSKLPPEQYEDWKKNRKRRKNSRLSLDMDASNSNCGLESFNSSKFPCNHAPDEDSKNKQNHNDTVLEEFSNHINRRGVSEVCLEPKRKNSDIDVNEKLQEVIKFISLEAGDKNNLMNEESFLEIPQDPSSFSVKNIEELLSSNYNNSKQRKLFRRHFKSQEMKAPKHGQKGPNSESSVILKPGSSALKSYVTESRPDSLSDSRWSERARAYFSLAEVKRMWKNVMGKEQNPNTVVKRPNSRFRAENAEKKSQSKGHFFIEKIAKPRDPKVSSESETFDSSKQRMSNIYIDAKRHLSEMLSVGHEKVDSSSEAKSPKTLAGILALPDFDSPVSSPGRNWERNFMAAQMRFLGHNNNRFEKDNEDAGQKMVENNGSCLNSSTLGAETEPNNIVICDVDIEEETSLAAREDLASDANVIHEITQEECSITLASSELISLPIDKCVESIHSSNTSSNQDGETQIQKREVIHYGEPPSSSFDTPLSSCAMKTVEAPKISGNKPDRPSPVSVLEPLFMEEDISPANTLSESVELLIEPLEIKFEGGDNFNPQQEGNLLTNCMETGEEEEELGLYVMSVLQECGLNWNELYLKSQSSDQLLEPSLYRDTDFFSNHPWHDQSLVFNCINEVLLEVIDHYLRFCRRVSFVKLVVRPIPSSKDAIHEVWERVRWHLHIQTPVPQTLDQIVYMDMAKSEKWMDLVRDIESIGFEMGDEIFDDLIEDYVDESLACFYFCRN